MRKSERKRIWFTNPHFSLLPRNRESANNRLMYEIEKLREIETTSKELQKSNSELQSEIEMLKQKLARNSNSASAKDSQYSSLPTTPSSSFSLPSYTSPSPASPSLLSPPRPNHNHMRSSSNVNVTYSPIQRPSFLNEPPEVDPMRRVAQLLCFLPVLCLFLSLSHRLPPCVRFLSLLHVFSVLHITMRSCSYPLLNFQHFTVKSNVRFGDEQPRKRRPAINSLWS